MHDVIIVGAGPGGAATAQLLAASGLDVLLLDKAIFPRDKTCGDSLTPRAISVLSELGLKDEIHRVGHRIHGMSMRSRTGQVLTASIPAVQNLPNYVLTVPRQILDNLLVERALNCGANFHGDTHVTDIVRIDKGVEIRGSQSGQNVSFQSRMAVVAVGANMGLLRRQGILNKRPLMISAARGYFENLNGLTDRFEAHFEGVSLPGLGWIIPTSTSSANVGLGFWPYCFQRRTMRSARAAVDDLVKIPVLADMFAGAHRVGPVKGWPIRTDFAKAATFGGGFLLVGEAAGLVSPLTGAGIDLALESGKMAAEHLKSMFESGDFSNRQLKVWDKLLRDRYQKMFVFQQRFRAAFINPLLVDRLVAVACHRQEMSELWMNAMVGHSDGETGVSLSMIRKVVLGW